MQCCLYCEEQALYCQASGDLTVLNEVTKGTAGKTNQRFGELINSITGSAGRWATMLPPLPLRWRQGGREGDRAVIELDSQLIAQRPSHYEHIKGKGQDIAVAEMRRMRPRAAG